MLTDSLQGALALSLLDFILSFFFIAFIGLVLKAFPYVDRAFLGKQKGTMEGHR